MCEDMLKAQCRSGVTPVREHQELPCSPRVSSNDWIGKYKENSIDDVDFASVFNDDKTNKGHEPLPSKLGDFVPDHIFHFLERIERLDHLFTQVRPGVGCPVRRVSSWDWMEDPQIITEFDAIPFHAVFDDKGNGERGTQADSFSFSQKDEFFAFLCNIEEKTDALFGTTTPKKGDDVTAADTAAIDNAGPYKCQNDHHVTGEEEAGVQNPNPSAARNEGATGATLPDGPARVFSEPRKDDVLCGRGGRSNHHAGNKRYRGEVKNLKVWYKSSAKTQKTDLSQCLVNYVQSYGGRFLKQDKTTKKWYVVTNNEARKKASQALREEEKAEKEEKRTMSEDEAS